MGEKRQDVGARGEDIAAAYLEKNHIKIIERNYRTKRGEIDIIGVDKHLENGRSILVFVEVKARKELHYGEPVEAVTVEKMQRVCRAAEMYMLEHDQEDQFCRFDVIGIVMTPEGNHIEHIQDVIDY